MATTTQDIRFQLLAVDRSRSAFTSFKAGLSDMHRSVETFRKVMNRGLALTTFMMAINQIKTAIDRDLIAGADKWGKKWEVLIANWTGFFQKALLSIAMEFDTNFIEPLKQLLIQSDEWLKQNFGVGWFKGTDMKDLFGNKKMYKDAPDKNAYNFKDDMMKDLEAQVKILETRKEVIGKNVYETTRLLTIQKAMNEMTKAGYKPTEAEIALMKERAGWIAKLTDEIDKLEQKQQEQIQIQEMFKDAFVEFGMAIAEGRDVIKSLTDSLKRLSQRLLQMALEKSFDLLFGNMQTNQQGVFNFSSLLNLIPARAGGGPVSGGQTYLVGERGPELFTPRMGGNITSNDALGGGFSQTINIIDNGGNSVSTSTSPDGRQLNVLIDSRQARNAADPNTQFSRTMSGRNAKPNVKRR